MATITGSLSSDPFPGLAVWSFSFATVHLRYSVPAAARAYRGRRKLHEGYCVPARNRLSSDTARNPGETRVVVICGTSVGAAGEMAWPTATFLPSAPPLAASKLSFLSPAGCSAICRRLPMHSRSSLDEILTRAGPLPACFAKDGDILRKSHIYIAPPDRHLVVDGDHISLGEGPRENNACPAIDPMLRSAAVCCGS